jgi:two-component system cell cycle sensor histidine kinase/response regulator CckA
MAVRRMGARTANCTRSMEEPDRIAELERELAELRAELAEVRGAAQPWPGEDPGVWRLLAGRRVLADLSDMVALLDREHRVLYVNRGVAELAAADVLGRCVLDYMAEDGRAAYLAGLERAWSSGRVQTHEARSTSGRVWDTRFVPMLEDGRVTHLLVTASEVTERKRAEEALRASESRLRLAIEATGMGTWVREGKSFHWDEALCRFAGITAAEVPDHPDGFLKFIHPDDREFVAGVVQRSRETGHYDDYECRFLRADGSVRHVLIKGSVELDEDGVLLRSCGGVFDLTERRQLEDQMRQAQKMDAVGQLTSGIAHNFNNILGIILPSAELGARDAPPAVAARLADISQAAERGAEMVRQLMLFARRNALTRKVPLDLVACAQRTVEICRTTFDRGIRIELSVGDDPTCVLAHAGQIEQVLLNVCLNARDAFEQASTPHALITIEVDQPRPGKARIRVRDNGPGMDEATALRVFEPFFTTKNVQRGTGLGLASAYAIIQAHEGTISCESRPGAGATFTIELPATDHTPALPDTAQAPLRRGNELVLLVDDEPVVRRVARELLELGGYRVLEAEGGVAAIEIFTRECTRLGAVVLDRSMPDLSGDKVLARLGEIDPRVPVIMLSGHLELSEQAGAAAAVLTKPTSAAVLLRALRQVLDQVGVRT